MQRFSLADITNIALFAGKDYQRKIKEKREEYEVITRKLNNVKARHSSALKKDDSLKI